MPIRTSAITIIGGVAVFYYNTGKPDREVKKELQIHAHQQKNDIYFAMLAACARLRTVGDSFGQAAVEARANFWVIYEKFKTVGDAQTLAAMKNFEDYIQTDEYAENRWPNSRWGMVSAKLKNLTDAANLACRASLDND